MKMEHEASPSPKAVFNRVLGRSFGLISRAVARPSRILGAYSRHINTPPAVPVQPLYPVRPFPTGGVAGTQSLCANNPTPIPSKVSPAYDDPEPDIMPNQGSDDHWIQSALFARQLQNEFDFEDWRLRQEQEGLAAQYMQPTFQCRICMNELPGEDIANVDACMHTMCRTCLREFVSLKIQERRYPIVCPLCNVAKDRNTQPGEISRVLIEQLGISEEQSLILAEMELAGFTVPIYCRMCQRSASMDREDYSEATNIMCPQCDCHHVWCKKCEQTIVVNGPQHSCDGSSELDHLMKEKGWKYCPNCKTPIQKEVGCNHMTCISPGCNTHFCYVCGGSIVQSAFKNEIDQAVSAHFRRCQLFEVTN